MFYKPRVGVGLQPSPDYRALIPTCRQGSSGDLMLSRSQARCRWLGGICGFPPKSWRLPYAASGRMAVIFSYSIGGSNPAELCRRRAL